MPDNIEICKSILKLIHNESVTIKESTNEKSGTSLYVVATNSIIIAKIQDSYTRVQTIAHECIHSIQNKKLLWFNFIFTNIYLLYFAISIALTILNIYKNTIFHAAILLSIGLVHFAIRSILEVDAMTRAKNLAKDYLESTRLYSEEEIENITDGYDKINKIGIKVTVGMIFINMLIKVGIYIVIGILT